MVLDIRKMESGVSVRIEWNKFMGSYTNHD